MTVSARIRSDIWYKLWGNMTMHPVSALAGETCDRILDDPLLDCYCLAIMAEAGRPLEIDALLTAVTEIGAHVGVPTPNTDALLGLVRVFEGAQHG